MTPYWIQKSAVAGLGLATTLFLGVAGCGGKGGQVGDAVVYPEPGTSLPSGSGTGAAPATTATGAPASSTTAAGTSTPSAPVKAEGWGTLKGQVTFGGNPTAPEILVEQGKAPKDPTVCAKDAPIKSERLVVDASTKGVKNVIVYIPKPTAVNEEAKSAASSANVEFDQEHCIFKPRVVAALTSAKIVLKSSDPVNHNINAKLKNNTPFNSVLSAGQSIPFVSTAGERTPAEVTCDIHPWMRAYWLITDSPYFAVTDEKGNFEIKNVPAGTQKVVVWQEAVKGGGFVTPASGDAVNVKANDTTTQSFTIDPGKILPGK
jgi:hypothetical protein